MVWETSLLDPEEVRFRSPKEVNFPHFIYFRESDSEACQSQNVKKSFPEPQEEASPFQRLFSTFS